MPRDDLEDRVKACYSTWSTTYADEYYGPDAPYPPVHADLVRRLLREHGARSVLDAGCGPATLLRDLVGDGLDVYGFDLTPGMVEEARRVLGERGVAGERVWEGSVLDAAAFAAPPVDAAVCIGVLPHVPEQADAEVIANLRDAVRPGGLVVVEARNELFALFTLNRYSYEFFAERLLRLGDDPGLEPVREELRRRFRMELPPVRRGKEGEPGYDEILSRTHNPFVLRDRFAAAGLRDTRVLFYHYHWLPPMFEPDFAGVFRERSVALEDPDDWRGHFMASAFLLAGARA